jgi:hypothetical protein
VNAVVKAKGSAKKVNGRAKLKAVPQTEAQAEPIRILHRGVLVQPLLDQLAAQPQLWNQNVFRTGGEYTGNPHQRIDDIIVRFNDWKNWNGDRAAFNEEHESVWWGPYLCLPAIKPLVFDLMRWMYAERLGMVLITRIPPRTNVERHVDRGWHARHYLKFAVQLKSAPGQKFCYDSMELETKPGDLYAFNNSIPHWVENPTDEERITLIMCLRLETEICMNYQWSGK